MNSRRTRERENGNNNKKEWILQVKKFIRYLFFNWKYPHILEWKTVIRGGNWEKSQEDRNNEVSAEWMALESNFLESRN